MLLHDSIVAEHTKARKDRDSEKLAMLQVLMAAIKNESISQRRELSDEEVQGVVKRQVKQLKDALSDFERANREDLITKTRREIGILESFLPEPLSREELEKIIKKVIDEMKPSGPQDFGKVMGLVMKETKGKADGNLVRESVQKLLSS